MTRLRQRMIEDMQLRGLSEKTQESYLRAVRQLAEHYGESPKHVSEEELRQYFLYLTNVRELAPSTIHVALNGITFLFQHTLRRDWPMLNLVRPRRERTLPVVLSVSEVHQVLNCVRRQRYYDLLFCASADTIQALAQEARLVGRWMEGKGKASAFKNWTGLTGFTGLASARPKNPVHPVNPVQIADPDGRRLRNQPRICLSRQMHRKRAWPNSPNDTRRQLGPLAADQPLESSSG